MFRFSIFFLTGCISLGASSHACSPQLPHNKVVNFNFSDQPKTGPTAMIAPASFWHFSQESDFEKRDEIQTAERDGASKLNDSASNGSNNPPTRLQPESPEQDRNSDRPVAVPELTLSAPPTTKNRISDRRLDRGNQGSDYELSIVADERLPIGAMPLSTVRQNDPAGILVRGRLSADASQAFVDRSSRYGDWNLSPRRGKVATWEPPNFAHRPLYFEERHLERFGNATRLPSLNSGVRFFTAIPRLPYQLGQHPPNSAVYEHRVPRPGDVVPGTTRVYLDERGSILQTLISLGVILP